MGFDIFKILPKPKAIEDELAKQKGEEPSKLTVPRFAAKAALTLADMTFKLTDYVSSYVGKQVGKYIDVQTKVSDFLNPFDAKDTYVKQTWEEKLPSVVQYPFDSLQENVKDLQQTPYIRPTDEWSDATLIEKFSTKHFPETVYNTGADIVGSMGPYLIPVIGPALGFALNAGSTANEVKDVALENGASDEYADNLSFAAGLLVGAVGQIVPVKTLGALGKANFSKNFFKRLAQYASSIAKTSFGESITEVTETNIQLLAESTVREVSKDEFIQGSVMSAFAGALGGGFFKATADVINAVNNRDLNMQDMIIPALTTVERPARTPVTIEGKPISPTLTDAEKTKYSSILNLKNPEDVEQLERIIGVNETAEFIETKTYRGKDEIFLQDLIRTKIVDIDTKKESLEFKPFNTENLIFFHGTSAQNIESIKTSGLKKGSELPMDNFRGGGYGLLQKSVSLSKDSKIASIFTGDSNRGVVLEAIVNPDAFITQIDGVEDSKELNEYADELIKKGVDAVWIGGGEQELVVLNPKILTIGRVEEFKVIDGFTGFKTKQSPQFIRERDDLRPKTYGDVVKTINDYKKRLKLTNLESQVVDVIMDKHSQSFASSFGNTVSFTRQVPEFAADHEVMHTLLRNAHKLDIGITRKELQDEARLRYGDLETVDLEEKIAEDFEMYVEMRLRNQPTTIFGKLEKFFENIFEAIRKVFAPENIDVTRRFFEFAFQEEQSNPVVVSGTDTKMFTKQTDAGTLVLDFGDIQANFKRKIEPEEVVRLKERKREIEKAFDESEASFQIETEVEFNKEMQEKLEPDVLSAIKNNIYFKREGTLQDTSGEGFIMRSPKGRLTLVEPDARERFIKKGYEEVLPVEMFAQEHGFYSGIDFLEDQLNLSRLDVNEKALKRSHLEKTDPEYKNVVNKLDAIKAEVRGEKVTFERYLTDLGKRSRTQHRRVRLRAVQEFFNLSSREMKQITKRDYSLMTDAEFDKYLNDLDTQIISFQETVQKKSEVMQLIRDRKFIAYENLQKALQLPVISKMNLPQLEQFFAALEPYQMGDVFISPRRMEVIDNTKIAGARTIREIREALAQDASVPLSELEEITSTGLDKILYDVALARKNPLYEVIVNTFHTEWARNEIDLTNKLISFRNKIKLARTSNRTLGKMLIPQDEKVIEWLESKDKQKVEEKMTPEELEAAIEMQITFKEAYDELLKRKVLTDGIENYYTHIRRGFLETVKDDGLLVAFKEVFKQNELDKMTFNIIDDDTGTILPYEKFFQFALQRTGELTPTKNAAKAYEAYIKTYYKKIALDSVVPLVDMYVYSLEPKRMTEKGIQMDRTLRKFINEWLNNKRGRPFSFGGLVKPGGKVDISLRFARTFTSMIDLGLNVATGVAATVGEQVVTFKGAGPKVMIKGIKRQNTRKGRAFTKKYEQLFGHSFIEELFMPEKDIGEKLQDGLFSLFSIATLQANKEWVLGSLTEKEFETTTISPERIAQLRLDIGRQRVVKNFKSIVGTTSVGNAMTQYKTWAIPVLHTTISNWNNLIKQVRSRKINTNSREFIEEFRGLILISFVIMLIAAFKDEDDKTFAGQLKSKALREASTTIQALRPSTFAGVPRIVTFMSSLAGNLEEIATAERYKTTGKLKGVQELKRQFTPAIVRQLKPKETKRKTPSLNLKAPTVKPRKRSTKKRRTPSLQL